VLMTGHAFQCLLTDEDQLAFFQTVAAHLAPGGRFMFDSREPACQEWLEWMPDRSQRTLWHPELGQVRAWNDARHDPATNLVSYDTFYEAADGRRWQAQSRIRFTPQFELGRRLAVAGLAADCWFGDWQGGPIGADKPEIIVVGHLAG